MADGQVNYQVNIVKGTDSLPEVNAELQGTATAEAAAGEAGRTSGSVLAEAHEVAAGAIRSAHHELRLFHMALGMVALVVGGLVELFMYFKNRLNDLISSTREAYTANLDYADSFKKAEEAGVKLSNVELALKNARNDQAQAQLSVLLPAMREKNVELTKEIAAAKEAMEQGKMAEMSDADEAKTMVVLRKTYEDLNAQLKQNEADMVALKAGHKDAKEALDAETASAKAAADEKKKIKDAAMKNEEEAALQHVKMMEQIQEGETKSSLNQAELSTSDKKRIIIQGEIEQEKLVAQETAIRIKYAKDGASEVEKILSEANDKVHKLSQKANADAAKLDEEELKKKLESMQKITDASAQAAEKQIEEGNSLGQAMDAAAGAAIASSAKAAAQQIDIYGLQAAASAFAWGSAEGGPVAGFAAAGITELFFSGLAAAVGGAGSKIGSSMTASAPSSSTSSSSGSVTDTSKTSVSKSGTVTTTDTLRGTGSQASAVLSASGSADGGGGGTIQVNLYLDSDVILKMIRDASFNGNLVISANAIKG